MKKERDRLQESDLFYRFIPAVHMWRLLGLLELVENMRQKGDTRFTVFLSALDVGGLKSTHFAKLMSKILTRVPEFLDLDRAILLYLARAQFVAYKTVVLEQYRVKGVLIFRIQAQVVLVNADNVNMTNFVLCQVIPTIQRIKKVI